MLRFHCTRNHTVFRNLKFVAINICVSYVYICILCIEGHEHNDVHNIRSYVFYIS
jgi:hypothetical protein